ncbi:MAG: hypothetical protein ACFFD4_15550 [Candidatus Odinarchaeota archaeon]
MLEDEHVIPLLNELLFYGVVAAIAVSSDMLINLIWMIVYGLFLAEDLAFLETAFIGITFLFFIVARALSGSVMGGTLTAAIKGLLSVAPYLFALETETARSLIIVVMLLNLIAGITIDTCFYLAYMVNKKYFFIITGGVLPVLHVLLVNPLVAWFATVYLQGIEYDLANIMATIIPNLLIGVISGLIITGSLAQLACVRINDQHFLPFDPSLPLRDLVGTKR